MRKITVESWKRCPICGKTENQIKARHNGSGSQRCKCKECGKYRRVGRILKMNKSNVVN